MKLNLSCLVVTLLCAFAVRPASAQPAASDPYEGLAKFQFGQSRQPLALIEEQIRKAPPADHKAIEAKLLEVLKAPSTPKDAKRYICRWLAVVGSAECVPAVAELLTDVDLCHAARMALEPMANPAAGAALRAALPQVNGKLLAGVIGSIGVRRDDQAVAALSGLINHNDPMIAGAALAALGQIGTEEAANMLNQAKVPDALAHTIARARLAAADHLVKANKSSLAVATFRNLLEAQHPQAIRIAALKGLIGALPLAESSKLIIDMVQGEEVSMRNATVAAYVGSADKTLKDTVARELPNTKPAGQLILLGVLADMPEVAARPSALVVLVKTSSDDGLRVAALDCLVRHGEAVDVPMLVSLAGGRRTAVSEAARKALLRMGQPGVDNALVQMIESSQAESRAVVLATLANRRVESALPTLVRLMGGADATLAVEAAKALGVMGRSEQLSPLAKIIAATENAALRNEAEESAKAICRRTPDKQASASVLLAALEHSTSIPARVALLQTLLYTGGEQALNAVVKARQDNNAEVAAAATRALIAWPEASAGPHLLELARGSQDAGQAAVALRDGCLRLAEMDELPLAQRVSLLRGVLEAAKRPEEKKRAIADLAEIPSLASLELLQGCAKDAALQGDTAKAMSRLARQMGVVYNRQTLAALQALKALAATDEIRNQVEAALKAAQNAGQSPDGFILAWLLSGPYTQEGKDGSALFDIAFAPEKSEAQVEWRPVTGAKSGLVELDKIMRGDNRVAYLKTQITSDKDQEALLEMGSDDGIKAWINSKVVHANNTVRPCAPGEDKVKIKLKQGVNNLLLKITQGAGQWSACCRLRAADGKELPDVIVGPSAE